jgi:hypothetical protein
MKIRKQNKQATVSIPVAYLHFAQHAFFGKKEQKKVNLGIVII